jgi:hypothetical protein
MGLCKPRMELKMWMPRKMLVVHNARETLADCSKWAWYTTRAQPIGNKNAMPSFPIMYVWWARKMVQDDQVWYDDICMMLWLCLKALSLFFATEMFLALLCFVTMRVTRTKVAMICMREQNFGTWEDTMVYARYDSYAAYVSLMCTSNVARQFSMASLDG